MIGCSPRKSPLNRDGCGTGRRLLMGLLCKLITLSSLIRCNFENRAQFARADLPAAATFSGVRSSKRPPENVGCSVNLPTIFHLPSFVSNYSFQSAGGLNGPEHIRCASEDVARSRHRVSEKKAASLFSDRRKTNSRGRCQNQILHATTPNFLWGTRPGSRSRLPKTFGQAVHFLPLLLAVSKGLRSFFGEAPQHPRYGEDV